MFYPLIRPLLFKLDAEHSHELAFVTGQAIQRIPFSLPVINSCYRVRSPYLTSTVLGIKFDNPVGIAAGFDKNGKLLPLLAALGFGFVEVGSITNRAVPGNHKPRLFRLPSDNALINRMGLNNDGPEVIASRLSGSRLPPGFVVAVNIAKTPDPKLIGRAAVDDMVACYRKVATNGSFVVINVSCPNTEDGRNFEAGPGLDELLSALSQAKAECAPHLPMLVKFSPDISTEQLEHAIECCRRHGVSGYVLVNTSVGREGLSTSKEHLAAIGSGGLSGAPLTERAVSRVRHVYKLLKGSAPIIGVGGVDSADSAYELILAGASLVEAYTGLVYRGPSLSCVINRGLIRLLKRDGLKNIADAVGRKE